MKQEMFKYNERHTIYRAVDTLLRKYVHGWTDVNKPTR